MLKTLRRSHSSFRVLIKHFSEQALRIIRNVVPIFRVKSKLLFKDVLKYFFIVVAFERGISTQEDKKNNSKAPDITCVIVATF